MYEKKGTEQNVALYFIHLNLTLYRNSRPEDEDLTKPCLSMSPKGIVSRSNTTSSLNIRLFAHNCSHYLRRSMNHSRPLVSTNVKCQTHKETNNEHKTVIRLSKDYIV